MLILFANSFFYFLTCTLAKKCIPFFMATTPDVFFLVPSIKNTPFRCELIGVFFLTSPTIYQQALNLLYEHYSDALYGVISKIVKNDELAEDTLQETFVKVWRYADKYDADKAKLFTWLYRIARNTAIDKLRSHNLKHQKNNPSRLPTKKQIEIKSEQLLTKLKNAQKR